MEKYFLTTYVESIQLVNIYLDIKDMAKSMKTNDLPIYEGS